MSQSTIRLTPSRLLCQGCDTNKRKLFDVQPNSQHPRDYQMKHPTIGSYCAIGEKYILQRQSIFLLYAVINTDINRGVIHCRDGSAVHKLQMS